MNRQREAKRLDPSRDRKGAGSSRRLDCATRAGRTQTNPRPYGRSSLQSTAFRSSAWLTLCVLFLGALAAPANGQLFKKDDKNTEDIWAIRCVTLKGDNRHVAAEKYSDALRKVRGLKADLVQVIADRHESTVYYGRYKRKLDTRDETPRYTPDHLKDLELIRSLAMSIQEAGGPRDVWPFQFATMTALPTERGDVNNWNLTRAPGHYSLQVGVFYDTEGLKQRRFAAEEYCRLLRNDREEAYFYHGPAMSIVCIGGFPKEAIAEYREEDPYTGRIRFGSRIVDSRMLALQKKYPDNLQNGARMYDISHDPKTGEKTRSAQPSFPVEIPREAESELKFP